MYLDFRSMFEFENRNEVFSVTVSYIGFLNKTDSSA